MAISIAIGASACDARVHLGTLAATTTVDGGMTDGSSSTVLWSATFEPGDLSEWLSDGGGGSYLENVSTPITATTEIPAHKGRYAGKTTVSPSLGMATLSYLFRQQPSPSEAYYSAWFFVPSTVMVRSWLSVMHFRGSHTGDGRNVFPNWDLNLYALPSGGLAAQLYHYGTQVNLREPLPLPVGTDRWVHFEVLMRKALGPTGRVTVWQDDVQIFDAEGVVTAENDWLEWDAGSASDDLTPTPSVVYIDDAAISLTRVGSGG
jgi:hypothetical protein